MSEGCKNCRFWDLGRARPESHPFDDKESRCRRRPPIIDPIEVYEYKETGDHGEEKWINGIFDWRFWTQPFTTGADWCGEYEPRVDDTFDEAKDYATD